MIAKASAARRQRDRSVIARSSGGKQSLKIGSKTLTLTNLQKVLYPEAGFTKEQVIEYYIRIAPVLLPHLKNRPISMKRFPDGVDKEFFYQKNCPLHRPDWMDTQRVEREKANSKPIEYCVINNQAALVWTANLASIELHTFLSRGQNIDRPTMMVFDLDPGEGADLLDCCRVGLRLREALGHFDLQSLAKTSGGKGLHIAVPLNTSVTFEQTKPFARALAEILERENRAGVTSNMRKDLRKGKVFIDWSQNDRHKTTVSVYSLRARPRPTVSTPVTWREIEKAVAVGDFTKLIFESEQVLKRVQSQGDLFAPVNTIKQSLPRSLDASS